MILAFLLILIVFGFRLAFRFKLVVSLPAALELGFLGDWEAGGLGFFGGWFPAENPLQRRGDGSVRGWGGRWMGLRFQGWAVVDVLERDPFSALSWYLVIARKAIPKKPA
jgi:hypothetical protein